MLKPLTLRWTTHLQENYNINGIAEWNKVSTRNCVWKAKELLE